MHRLQNATKISILFALLSSLPDICQTFHFRNSTVFHHRRRRLSPVWSIVIPLVLDHGATRPFGATHHLLVCVSLLIFRTQMISLSRVVNIILLHDRNSVAAATDDDDDDRLSKVIDRRGCAILSQVTDHCSKTWLDLALIVMCCIM